ncbi:MAG: LysR family transcriptional regulator [Psychrobium sp.]
MQRKIDVVKAMRIFLSVVEEKSFSGASGKLGLATSAISKNVSDLEEYYECKLLHRNTRSMHLTAEGSHFVTEFKDVLAKLDGLKSSVFQRKGVVAGKLTITSPENAQGLAIDAKLSQFLQQYPNVELRWLQQNRRVNIVDEGIDVAIRVGRLQDSDLMVQSVATVDNMVVASPSYLKQHGVPEHPEELAQHQCIIEVANQRPLLWQYCEDETVKTVSVSGTLELDKGETVAYFAAQGQGIARLPSFMMQKYLDSGELIPILSEFSTAPLEVSLVYPKDKLNNPVLTAFIEFMKQW